MTKTKCFPPPTPEFKEMAVNYEEQQRIQSLNSVTVLVLPDKLDKE